MNHSEVLRYFGVEHLQDVFFYFQHCQSRNDRNNRNNLYKDKLIRNFEITKRKNSFQLTLLHH